MSSDFGLSDAQYSNEYAIDREGGGVRYPHLQVDNYRPANAKTPVRVGIPDSAMNLIPPDSPLHKAVKYECFTYGDDGVDVDLGLIDDSVRWVILARPRIMGLVKATNDVVPLSKGMRERGEVTISKVLLACLVDGELILDENQNPQIFTLKLKSNKTGFVGNEQDKDCGMSRNNGHRTIAQLNKAIVSKAEGKPGQWLAHTASVVIGAVAEKFTGRDGKSSWGVRFVFPEGTNAKPLPSPIAKQIFQFVSTESFKELAKDPLGLNRSTVAETEQPRSNPATETDFDDMPF